MTTLAVFRGSNGNCIKGVLGESRDNAANVRNGAADARVLKRDVFGLKKRPVKEICTPTSPAAPLAVARRNARERNRVRQVNDGFAALRRRIPDEVADAFENANSNRGPNKKLSKVETLRMAVEYIRSLEALLNVTREDGKENDVGYPSPASSSPHGPSSFERGYFSLHSPPSPPPADDDEFSDPPTPALPLHALYEDDDAPLTPGSDELLHLRLQDLHAPLPDAVEQQFTVIEPDDVDYCDDLQHPEAEYLDIKYVNPEQLEQLAQEGTCIQLLQGVSSINPHLILAQDQFQCVPGDRQIFINENSVIIDGNAYFGQQMALKEETPEVDDFNLHEDNCENLENSLKW